MSILNEHLQKSFQKSRWYKADGNFELNTNLTGVFNSQITETPVIRYASYFVQVPYQESFRRVKQSSPTSKSNTSSSLFELLSPKPVEKIIDNRDETETVTITKYRREERIYKYMAHSIEARKKIEGHLVFSLDQQNLNYKIEENLKLIEDKHNENFPEANLKPQTPLVPTDEQWISSLGDSFVQKLTDSLQNEWTSRFCSPLVKLDSTSANFDELIHRCTYQLSEGIAPEVVNQYYLSQWKISYNDYKSLLVN